jgi:formylglycine-generating enzyme required for sulfatase activity
MRMLGFIARLAIAIALGGTLALPAHAEEKTRAETDLVPGRVFRDCDECPEIVVVPAGSFTMGSPTSEPGSLDTEGPQHPVTIARPFAVGRYEVTFAEWDACVSAGGCSYAPHDGSIGFGFGFGRGKRPVINVSWDDTKQYVSWINSKVGKQVYRLLTEAEWEYAARAATTTPYAFGPTLTRSMAQFNANRTAPVGSFPPNEFGLFDMHGNVSEWVQDCWNDSYEGAPADGSAWTTGECGRRVVRGGAWNHPQRYLRAAYRDANSSDARGYILGFRLARTLEVLIAASPKAVPSDATKSEGYRPGDRSLIVSLLDARRRSRFSRAAARERQSHACNLDRLPKKATTVGAQQRRNLDGGQLFDADPGQRFGAVSSAAAKELSHGYAVSSACS